MDIKTRLNVIQRNTAEILTKGELKQLLEKKHKPVVYHGFEPSGSGIVHIGYMIGLNKLIDFQQAGLKVITLFADLHAWLNEKGSLEKIEETAKLYNLCFEALGLDTKRSEAVMGSSFQLNDEYVRDILKLSLRARMARARRAMDVIGREEDNPHVAQVIYPLMQTVDIKYLGVDIAFGDTAQRKIHMLAREELSKLGHKAPVCIHHADIVGLTGEKMSSSKPETIIAINESPAEIKKKIGGAYCPPKVFSEENPVFSIARLIILPRAKRLKVERPRKYGGDVEFLNIKDLEKAYKKGLHPQDLKNAVSRHLTDILKPARRFLDNVEPQEKKKTKKKRKGK